MQCDDSYNRIDLLTSKSLIAKELRELFRPSNEATITYSEFCIGVNKMASSYASRSQFIQSRANLYVQKKVSDAVKHSSNGVNKIEYEEIIRNTLESQNFADAEPVRCSAFPEAPAHLFRSYSIGEDEFENNKSYFVPNRGTLDILHNCFEEFFVNGNNDTSLRKEDASDDVRYRYGQMWELFAGGDGLVRRSDFISGVCTAAENFLLRDSISYKKCAAYTLQKVDRAVRYLYRVLDEHYPIGTKVMCKYYQLDVPVVIRGKTRCKCNRPTCQSPIKFEVTMVEDPTNAIHVVSCFDIRLPKEGEGEEVARPALAINKEIVVMDTSDEAYECDSFDILTALIPHFGESFRCGPEKLPKLKSCNFNYWFVIDDVKRTFNFDQFDYGIKFTDFLLPEVLAAEHFNPERLKCSAAANESMRCFFLHLGVAVGIHPFALEVAYRKLAVKLLENPPAAESDSEARENYVGFNSDPLASVQSRGNYVDSMALAAIWPKEFDDVQVLIVNLTATGSFNKAQGFTHIRPPTAHMIGPDGEWLGKDILLTLQCGHFTYLCPQSTNTDENVKTRPIATMLECAKALDFNVALPYFTIFPELFPTQFAPEYRVSIDETLRDFLHSPRPPEPPIFVPTESDISTSLAEMRHPSHGNGVNSEIQSIIEESSLSPTTAHPPPTSSSPTLTDKTDEMDLSITEPLELDMISEISL